MSNEVLKALVALEGHCCLRGYLLRCRSEGQSSKDMAAHMGVSPSTITYNYRRLDDEKRSHRCACGEKCYEKGLPKKPPVPI